MSEFLFGGLVLGTGVLVAREAWRAWRLRRDLRKMEARFKGEDRREP